MSPEEALRTALARARCHPFTTTITVTEEGWLVELAQYGARTVTMTVPLERWDALPEAVDRCAARLIERIQRLARQ